MNVTQCRDSTALLQDGEALSQRLSTDGYLFIRGLIPREAIMEASSKLLNIASKDNWLAVDSAVLQGIVSEDFDPSTVRDPSAQALKAMWCDETLHRLRSHENIVKLFERIFKEPVLVHPNFFLRNFFAKDSPTDSHQDKIFVGGGDFCTMWVPLGDYSVANGVLTVAAGSNHQGIRKAKFAGMGTLDDLSGTWVTHAFNAGDVLIFTNLTVHRSMPNLTNKLRQSFDARYQPARLSVVNSSLVPSADSGCADWDGVYANWKSKADQFYWKKFDLKIDALEKNHYEADYPAAFERALNGDLSMRETLLRLI